MHRRAGPRGSPFRVLSTIGRNRAEIRKFRGARPIELLMTSTRRMEAMRRLREEAGMTMIELLTVDGHPRRAGGDRRARVLPHRDRARDATAKAQRRAAQTAAIEIGQQNGGELRRTWASAETWSTYGAGPRTSPPECPDGPARQLHGPRASPRPATPSRHAERRRDSRPHLRERRRRRLPLRRDLGLTRALRPAVIRPFAQSWVSPTASRRADVTLMLRAQRTATMSLRRRLEDVKRRGRGDGSSSRWSWPASCW